MELSKKSLLIIIALFLLAHISVGQNHKLERPEMLLQVIKTSKVGHTYCFDNSQKNNHDETQIIYLGRIELSDSRIFKILTCAYIWGPIIIPQGISTFTIMKIII
jgi:uncharacterized protein YacL